MSHLPVTSAIPATGCFALVPSLPRLWSFELATGWPIAAKKSIVDDTRPQIDEDHNQDFGLRNG
jgi:hypothetical protein